ncbi:MAG: hypothetical protein QM831_39885 [Kofleriaceae bacterium]
MQQSTGTSSKSQTSAPPVQEGAEPREEDSGLHDIRSLAQSTKQRISSKKITVPPTNRDSDDDVLASSSASWKNLALPQPAAMVSLPELDELPSKAEIKKQQKVAAKATGPAATVSPAQVEASASQSMSGAVEFKPAFSGRFEQQKQPARAKSPNRNRNIALLGMGLAAAAGGVIFVMTQKKDAQSAQPTASQTAAAPAGTPDLKAQNERLDQVTNKMAEDHARAEAAENAAPATGAGAPAQDTTTVAAATPPVAQPAPSDAKMPAKPVMSKHGAPSKTKDVAKAEVVGGVEAPAASPKTKGTGGGGKAEGDGADPDFNQLLKEAGVNDKKAAAPKLDKKELTSEDFKKGMQAIQSKAAACYKGTQGSANVKLTIAPSGAVSKVTVSGVFAGKPEADCVSSAVKSASFPAWDGAPQSFGYPILLSE